MSDFQHAQLDWDENGQPLSRAFGDVYFSRHSGLNETRHVFLATNRLAERFAALGDGEVLCIGETGFGTGLNFLCAWQLFERVAPAGARLEFVSVEKFPLAAADLRRALALWPELAPWSEALLGQYLAVHPGFQRLAFAGGRVGLTLLLGDALECLPQLDARVDAWFLDGFAPAKNPDMWSPVLFAELARLSAPQATLGTFTSAGFVRRGLVEAGFAMQRVPGYGQKREMLSGTYQGPPANAGKPWYARPAPHAGRRAALVVGGGLAGCASAASLAARGWQVTLIERHPGLAREASGNPQGVLYLKLSAHGTPLSRLVLSGFGHTRRLLERLRRGHDWDACGVLQLAFDAKEAQRQAQLAAAFPADMLHGLEREQAERLAGVALPAGGLFYPEAGWVHPPALCQALAATPGITLLSGRAVRLRREGDDWCAYAGDECLARAPLAILATAADIRDFPPAAELPLKRIRGQVTRLPATPQSRALRTVVCAEGYVAPPRGDEHTLGASFDFKSEDLAPTLAEHQGNLELLREISPDLLQRLGADDLPLERLEGRAAFRCTSPDYLPLVGPLAERAAFDEVYAVLARDARQVPERACPWLPGLYLNSGHGSRGLISAPLSGELLAAWICGEPLPLPRAVAEACHPNRFLLRDLVRGQRG
ncbi:bifunctional tRNA (5-methylaminomethyl-2-thiouridine)(34)-methyltransferase MnmD/FAD-dependent 5-carboxymethylaminomethyl-2-thiouridine(34) oxidoreductase MnmC [Pseudomonas aeruginosa]|nr:bifunctional tRNA (5-methylaminomethyl-2-thiouridine)(34)-methyltransferase MnmD/FAD-dependent 5-carboxymethylaminomethyl-2-thiouridine(34) oxidoreductase MnmC [Pseudomonas aeruginosa]